MTRSQIQPLLVSRNETLRLLGVCSFTLWKWKLTGVLEPLTLDGQTAAYFLPDVEKVKASVCRDGLKPGRRKKKLEASV